MGLDTRIVEFNELTDEEVKMLEGRKLSEFNYDEYVTRIRHLDYNNDFPYIAVFEKDFNKLYRYRKLEKYFKPVKLVNDGYNFMKNDNDYDVTYTVVLRDANGMFKMVDSRIEVSNKEETFYVAKIREFAYWRKEYSLSKYICKRAGKPKADGLIPGYLRIDRRIIDACKEFISNNKSDWDEDGKSWERNKLLETTPTADITGRLFLLCDY